MTTLEKAKKYLENIEKDNHNGKKINAILHINPNVLEEAKIIDEKIKAKTAGKLAGKIIAIKAVINVKDMNCNCASKTLENYISPYDATVIEKIKNEDGLIIGIANCDEFACGVSGKNSAYGLTKNPEALDRIPGGSSSGSAASVAANFCDMSLGTDTGGSIRTPASCCNLIGLKPTYGLVSRYGLIDMAMSFDTIGPITKTIDDCLLLLNVIKGKDEKDSTSFESKEIKIEKVNALKIGIPKVKCDQRISELINKKLKILKNLKVEINLPHVDLGIQTYYPIVYTEVFSGTRKFDGRRFGKKIEDSCGEEVLRRILGGKEISKAEYEGKYYRKALQAKELIKQAFEKAFETVDFIIMPTLPILPWKLTDKLSVEEEYNADALTCLANIAGLPSLNIPAGKIEGIPVGMQIYGKWFSESSILSLAKEFE